MAPVVWPCALNPSNHILVQELLLHASLGRHRHSLRDRKDFFHLARHISCLKEPCKYLVSAPPTSRGPLWAPWRSTVPRQIVFNRILRQCTDTYTQSSHKEDKEDEEGRRVPVFYDDAIAHLNRIAEELGPHGYKVTLVGTLRRGCPVASRAEFLLTYDDDDRIRKHRDNDTTVSHSVHFERAIQGLRASGYIKHHRTKGKIDIHTKQYITLASRSHSHPETLSTSQEERQVLSITWSKPQQFHTRQLFLTGPNPFVVHLVLLAHAKGLGLDPCGLYKSQLGFRESVALECERDIFAALQLPYVEPIHRHAYCRVHNLF
ncbi:hypothetical protein, conserved [Trypanosoma brucei gambiense DAL972]|uniref:DNA polymerase beta thumb domain-containing protein n=1 Tax=Trypanosoma brucei gambiense (strain MHOM/CI/86/DAL972) TaxID=679716 RepID=C9ZXI8_TRYB9|nr:hypothetical protein, conserved [Trypanosoma brucei gambiense DAL972]CBH14132.1 hypothetical protein, conserved [Trypanosoma brucei gambiense DAL972]|eukprot:XP_011776403.1 hypothetical protein, conserved [Trypanosoma brucei gambiense DAL972]